MINSCVSGDRRPLRSDVLLRKYPIPTTVQFAGEMNAC